MPLSTMPSMIALSLRNSPEEPAPQRSLKLRQLQERLLIAEYNAAFYAKHFRYEEAQKAAGEVQRLKLELAELAAKRAS